MSEPVALPRAVSATLLPGFEGTTLPEWVAALLRDGLGGVCLFEMNIVSPEQLRELTDSIYAANPRAIIATDEEGGDVTRLHFREGSPVTGNAILGRIDDLDQTESVARGIGWELRRAGVNLDFAPDADINSNPDNPVIGVRSFGTEPTAVAAHTAAWTRGIQSTGVAACAKHFPGHGDTAQDSHLALPVVDRSLAQLRERELMPFTGAIAAGTKTIMTSHIVLPQLDPQRPATLSRPILRGLLREELAFDGVIVSDALDMTGASGEIGIPEAAVRALDAGCDLLCIGSANTAEQLAEIERVVLRAVADGRLAETEVRDAAGRVFALADTLATERDGAPIPATTADLPAAATVPADAAGDIATASAGDLERVIRAFEVKPWVPSRLAATTSGLRIARIETLANNAVGGVPWGVIDALETIVPIAADTADTDATPGLDPGAVLVVLGRDIHQHAFARAAVDRLRGEHLAIVVVDMGWPADDRKYADIATFGASRLVGRALEAYLAGATR